MSWVSGLRVHAGTQRLRCTFEVLFCAFALATVLPLFAEHYLPIQDFPQHAAAVRVLWDYRDESLGFARFFERAPASTQYLSVYVAAGLLSSAFGAVTALKLVLSAALLALPYALRSVLAALRKPQSYALLALPLTYNAHLILGFINFLAALPLLFFGIALAIRLARAWSRGTFVALASVLLVCFYTHVVPYALLVLTSLLVFASARRARRGALLSLTLVPSGVAALVWFFVNPAGKALGSLVGGAPAEVARYLSVGEALRELPTWVTDVFHDEWDERAFALWLVAVIAVFVVGAAEPRPSFAPPQLVAARRSVAALVPLCVVGYFVMPASYGFMWPIHARFAWLAVLAIIPALPRVSVASRLFVGTGALVLAVTTTLTALRAFRTSGELEYAGLASIVAKIPPGSRVAGLIFDKHSESVKFSPYLHAVAWIQAERGGAVQFTFADFPHSPFRFRAENRPPPVPPRWEWLPERVDPRADLAWFEYILTRGRASSLSSLPRVAQSGDWSLWRTLRASP